MRQLAGVHLAAWQISMMDDANAENIITAPATIVEEVDVESADPATAESTTCTDGQNKVNFWLKFVAISRRLVMFMF